jgi:hypothetical protein
VFEVNIRKRDMRDIYKVRKRDMRDIFNSKKGEDGALSGPVANQTEL